MRKILLGLVFLGIISSGKSAFAATDESVDKMNSDVLEIIENLNISEEQLEFTKNEINNYLEETPLEVDLAFTNYSDHDIVVAHDEKTFIVPGTNVAITYGRQITEHPTTPTLSRETKLYNGTFTKTSYADVHVLYVNIGKIQLNTQVELFPNSLALLSNNTSGTSGVLGSLSTLSHSLSTPSSTSTVGKSVTSTGNFKASYLAGTTNLSLVQTFKLEKPEYVYQGSATSVLKGKVYLTESVY